MNVALATDVLVYAEGVNGTAKKQVALDLLAQLPPDATFIPVQVLGELLTVLVRKAGRSRRDATAAVLGWGDAFPLIETSPAVLLSAMDLVSAHQLHTWDAAILAAAADAGCRVLLSEDLQEGFTWSGVTVVNPFADPVHPLLAAIPAAAVPAAAAPERKPAGRRRTAIRQKRTRRSVR